MESKSPEDIMGFEVKP